MNREPSTALSTSNAGAMQSVNSLLMLCFDFFRVLRVRMTTLWAECVYLFLRRLHSARLHYTTGGLHSVERECIGSGCTVFRKEKEKEIIPFVEHKDDEVNMYRRSGVLRNGRAFIRVEITDFHITLCQKVIFSRTDEA